MDFENKHGRVYSWEDFTLYLRGMVYRRWGQGLNPDLTDDSLQVAHLALLESWVGYRKSVLPNGHYNLELATTFAVSRFWRNYYGEIKAAQAMEGEPVPDYRQVEDVEALSWMESVGEDQLQEWFRACGREASAPGVSDRTARRYKERAREAAKESFSAYQAVRAVRA